MLAAHYAYEEHFGDVIALAVNYGFSGKKPGQQRSNAAVQTDREHLQKMMRGEADAEPVYLTPEVVETIFAKDVVGAHRIDVSPPATAPEEDVAADVKYLKKLDNALKERSKNKEN
jgi:hypothetical protein